MQTKNKTTETSLCTAAQVVKVHHIASVGERDVSIGADPQPDPQMSVATTNPSEKLQAVDGASHTGCAAAENPSSAKDDGTPHTEVVEETKGVFRSIAAKLKAWRNRLKCKRNVVKRYQRMDYGVEFQSNDDCTLAAERIASAFRLGKLDERKMLRSRGSGVVKFEATKFFSTEGSTMRLRVTARNKPRGIGCIIFVTPVSYKYATVHGTALDRLAAAAYIHFHEFMLKVQRSTGCLDGQFTQVRFILPIWTESGDRRQHSDW